MFYALNWFLVVFLLALWSAAIWALHAVAAWVLASAGTIVGTASGAAAIRLPDWLAPWVPAPLMQDLSAWLAAWAPAIESVLQWLPGVAGTLTAIGWLAWLTWGLGAGLLLLLGVGLHVLIALSRRGSARASGPGTGGVPAAV
jgi:hypothetical protein